MAGHSKWSNIKHRKAGQDARRSKIFTKIIRELTVSARDGGGNIDDNPALRAVVEKARQRRCRRILLREQSQEEPEVKKAVS